MKSSVRSLVWYPGINEDIEILVRNCSICQNTRRKPAQNVHVEWPQSNRPFSRVHVDHFFFENHICFIAVDAFSRYIECEEVKSTSSAETIAALRSIFSRNGLCNTLASDNASCFTSYDMACFLKSNGIKHVRPPAYSSPSNGLAEVGVRILKGLLRKCTENSLSFKSKLAKVLLYYRSTPQSATKTPPCVLLNNRKYITRRDKINPLFSSEEDKNYSQKFIKQIDVGSHVLALNPASGPKWRKGVVVGQLGINVYNVYVKDIGLVWKRHLSQLSCIPEAHDGTIEDVDSSYLAPTTSDVNQDIDDDNDVFYDATSETSEASDEDVHPPVEIVSSGPRKSTRISRPPQRYCCET